MPDPVVLAEAGPVAILLVGIGALTIGFVRGWVVPGWLYHQEREQRLKAETQAERNTDAIEAIAAAVRSSLNERNRGA
ncbi:MAG TPA: hypothetical protein VI341_13840 [Actinomycetota bacterium]